MKGRAVNPQAFPAVFSFKLDISPASSMGPNRFSIQGSLLEPLKIALGDKAGRPPPSISRACEELELVIGPRLAR